MFGGGERAGPERGDEVRCKPPRGRPWLRGSMVSQTEAGFHPRETMTLPRNTLHTCRVRARGFTGQRTNSEVISDGARSYPSRNSASRRKLERAHLDYPAPVRDTAKSGTGVMSNRHLPYLAESFLMNLGGSDRDAKTSSPPMTGPSVGAAIVIRDRESRSHGEGPQSAVTSGAKVTGC